MGHLIPDGVWPTMLTPFTRENQVDYHALEAMVEWYISQGATGLFAVCQSSEMFFLNRQERTDIAGFVHKTTSGRVPVIASGHVSDSLEEQAMDILTMEDTGVVAMVLLTNRFALENQSDDVWLANLKAFLGLIPDGIRLGFYECPYPYKRVLTPKILSWCADTGRFLFLKDTSCDMDSMRSKLHAVKGTGMKIFNANSATLLDSLRAGISGYSGVMANFHPDLYAWLCRNWMKQPEKAEKLMGFLGTASLIERQWYPVNGKYHMQLEGLPLQLSARSREASGFTGSYQKETEQLHMLAKTVRK
ncbi:MAG: dihydrodipicolinate synthase family protein [Clostridia bacterium]